MPTYEFFEFSHAGASAFAQWTAVATVTTETDLVSADPLASTPLVGSAILGTTRFTLVNDGASVRVLAVRQGTKTLYAPLDGATLPDRRILMAEPLSFEAAMAVKSGVEPVTAVACFAKDTLIRTQDGNIPVQDLAAGDMVETLDSGVQPVRWISAAHLPRAGRHAPVKIKAGALGEQSPARDLFVSPNHRMVLGGHRAQALFGQLEVLVAAQDLLNDSTIRPTDSEAPVTYYHIMFDKHEVVFSNGAPSESFHPALVPVDHLAPSVRDEIFMIFPDLGQDITAYGCAARVGASGPNISKLLD